MTDLRLHYLTETGQKEVVLIRNRSGHYVVNGKINNQTVTFLLDTGATHVSVPQKIAQKLGLKRGQPVNVQTAAGVITTYTTVLDSISIGNIVMGDVKGGINPFMKGEQILLGMSFLKHLTLTQRNDTLTISIP
ncbi:MAG: TIGR02281 family clan AA aspartic protease [Gammaproteobacteria bacterium]|nr:TIGR02281 family clan AA aspartic protease [Gammaproteobacteria bacterium]